MGDGSAFIFDYSVAILDCRLRFDFHIQFPKICIILIFEYPKICIGVIDGQSSSQTLYALCDETYLKNSRFYDIISAEKQTVVFVTRHREPHKRLPISKTISKNFLDIFLDRAMLYGIRVFGGSNIKNAENPCKYWGFSVFYRLLSSSKIL